VRVCVCVPLRHTIFWVFLQSSQRKTKRKKKEFFFSLSFLSFHSSPRFLAHSVYMCVRVCVCSCVKVGAPQFAERGLCKERRRESSALFRALSLSLVFVVSASAQHKALCLPLSLSLYHFVQRYLCVESERKRERKKVVERTVQQKVNAPLSFSAAVGRAVRRDNGEGRGELE